jgi:ribosomal protein L40E
MVDNKIAWDTKCGVASNLSPLFVRFPLEKCYSDGHYDWLHTSSCLNCTATQLMRAEQLVCRLSVYTYMFFHSSHILQMYKNQLLQPQSKWNRSLYLQLKENIQCILLPESNLALMVCMKCPTSYNRIILEKVVVPQLIKFTVLYGT